MLKLEADVAIVGAGLAGLTAARELASGGVHAIVLEARERVGGRVFSRELGDGVAVDHGGQFVGPPREGPWLMDELSRELGVERFRTHAGGENLVLLDGTPRRFKGLAPATPPHAAAELVLAKSRLERLARTLPRGAPWRAPRAAKLDGQTYASWIERHVRTRQSRLLLRLATETLYAAEPEEISLLHALTYIRSTGRGHMTYLARIARGHQQEQFRGGAQLVARRIASALGERIVLAAPVRRVTVRNGTVELAGPTVTASCRRAIIAVPPSLACRIAYEPSLPARRDRATQRFNGGSVVTASLVYDEPFWRARGLSGWAASTHGPVRAVLDASPPHASCGILQAFVVAQAAHAVARLTPAQRRAAILDALVRLFGPRARTPELYFEKDWTADEWTRGCYHGLGAPRAWLEFGAALRAPLGALHWSGSETATWGLGTMEGAVDAGRRVAAEVAGELEASA